MRKRRTHKEIVIPQIKHWTNADLDRFIGQTCNYSRKKRLRGKTRYHHRWQLRSRYDEKFCVICGARVNGYQMATGHIAPEDTDEMAYAKRELAKYRETKVNPPLHPLLNAYKKQIEANLTANNKMANLIKRRP